MVVVDTAVLAVLSRRRGLSTWRMAMVCAVGVAVVLAAALEKTHFRIFRLLSCAIFLHGPILLIGSAVILRKSKKTTAACVIATLLILAVGIDSFFIEPTWLEVTYVRLETPKLDRPVRIVLLADLQTDRLGAYEKRVLRRVMEEEPDLILLAGDYLQTKWQRRESLRRQVNGFLKEIGFFFI